MEILQSVENPIRAYQERQKLAYGELADRLGISVEYAKKLAAGAIKWVEVGRAWEIDERTGGELSFDDLIAWGAANGHAPSAAVLARLARDRGEDAISADERRAMGPIDR